MKSCRVRASVLIVTVALTAFTAFAAETALDRYVKKPDSTYRYELVRTTAGEGYTTYTIDLTSQTWRTPADVDHSVWKHWLIIVKPDRVASTTGYLFITGGSVNDKAPAQAGQNFVETALTTHTVVAELRGIPNEPVTF